MRDEAVLNECLSTMTIDDIPDGELRWIAEVIGLEATLKLIWSVDGIQVYIPKSLKKEIKKRYAKKTFDGHNARSIAVRLDVSERVVYKWCAQKPNSNQIDLFEESNAAVNNR